jgi:glycerol uptake facilitator-like aquaporin
VLYTIAAGVPTFNVSAGFATNGYGLHSSGGYSLTAALVCETVMTAMFVLVILGATDKRTERLRSHCDRAVSHAHSLDLDPGHEHVGQPSPEYRRRDFSG